ncbi:hypothetical protein OWT26_19840 [Burkholderia sp. 1A5]
MTPIPLHGKPGGWEIQFGQWFWQTKMPGVYSIGTFTGWEHYLYIGIRTTNLDTGEVMMLPLLLSGGRHRSVRPGPSEAW